MSPSFKQRLSKLLESIQDEKVGDLVNKAKFYAEAVANGADPIEAMHGHLCGPQCMHWESMSAERKAKLRKAPWNKGTK